MYGDGLCVLIWFRIRTIPLAFRSAIVCVLIRLHIRTITLTFRRASVCVCLYCFASVPRQPLVPLHRATALRG